MSSPRDFSREQYESKTLIRVRYRGTCNHCGASTQTTPTQTPAAKLERAWVRCDDCGGITLCTQRDNDAGTEDDS